MNQSETVINEYWQSFLIQFRNDKTVRRKGFQAWGFGGTPDMADRLGKLVLTGQKSATASLVWSYEDGPDPFPSEGDYSIILDGRGQPMCIIHTTRLYVKPFDEVDSEQAFLEGEGDRSLEYWREGHWEFFSEECRQIGREPHLKMPVLCERFELLFPR